MQDSEQSIKPYRVLTLDGGGVRGVYTAALIQRLIGLYQNDNPNTDYDLGSKFDLICGTSTGAILASALSCGVPMSQVISLYSNKSKNIFPKPKPIKKNCITTGLWYLFNQLFSSSCNPSPLKNELDGIFKDETFLTLYEKRNIGLCIQSIYASTGQPRVFKTPHNLGKTDDNEIRLVDAIMSSCAAPTFFPVYRFERTKTKLPQEFVDGGLWANNPYLVGLIEALEQAKPTQSIEIISIGTCSDPKNDVSSIQNLNRGLCQWSFGADILDLSFRAQSKSFSLMTKLLIDALCKCQTRSIRGFRLEQQPISQNKVDCLTLDNSSPEAINDLICFGENDALHNHTLSHSNSHQASMLKDIFSNLKPINKEIY